MQHSKFILQIKEKQALLHYLHKGEIKETWTLDSGSQLPEYLIKNPQVKVNILVDTPTVNIKVEELPSLNPLDLWQLVKNRKAQLSRTQALHGSCVFRENKRWGIQAVGFGEEVELWLKWVERLPNSVGYITSFAYETYAIVKKLCNRPQWQMLLTLHEGGTLRMSLFHEKHLEFTRVVPLSLEAPPQQLAHSILEVLESTYLHIVRAYPPAEDKLNVFAVMDEETCKFLKPSFLAAHQIHTLTPYQLAVRLGLSGKVPFRLSDSILLRALGGKWFPRLRLSSSQLKVPRIFLPIERRKLLMGCCVVLGLLIVDKGIQIITTAQSLSTLKSQKRMLQLEEERLTR